MNRIYRLVWNRAMRVWQVSSELTRCRHASASGHAAASSLPRRPVALACTALLFGSLGSASVFAEGSSCVAGATQITITGTETAECVLADGQSVTVAQGGVIDTSNTPGIMASGLMQIGGITVDGSITGATRGIMIDQGTTVTGGIANTGTINVKGHGIEIGTAVASYVQSNADGVAIYNSGSLVSTRTGWGNESAISIWKDSQIGGDIVNTATGHIDGYMRGINVDTAGTVVAGRILNEGSISGGSYSIFNAGRIENGIDNDGTITGAINNTGTIGGIRNRGSIEGNITNRGTIDGGITNSGAITGDVQLGNALLQLTGDASVTGTILGGIGSSIVVDTAYAAGGNASASTLAVNGSASLTVGSGMDWSTDGGATIDGTLVLAGGALGGNVTVAQGGTLTGHGSIGGDLSLLQGSQVAFAFGTAGMARDNSVDVDGNLALSGATLAVTGTNNVGPGLYRLFTYGGTLSQSDGGLLPPDGGNYAVQTLTGSKQVNLLDTAGLNVSFWNGDGTASAGRLGGGSGIWSLADETWTDMTGATSRRFTPAGFAVFAGGPGTVTVNDAVQAGGLQFASDGYTLTGNTVTLTGPGPATVRVGDGTAAAAAWHATIGNVIAGTSGLAKTDLGTLVLTGDNTYSGGTFIKGGTLSVSGDANLGAVTSGLTLDGGTLQITGSDFHETGRTIALGDAGGSVDIVDTGNTFTVDSALSGAGSLVKTGNGTLALTGANSYTGGTTIGAGTLRGDSGSLQGDIVNNSALVFDQAGDGRYAGTLSGTGTLSKQGNGILELAGNNSYTGGTTVSAGVLSVASDANLGAIGGGLTLDGGTLQITGTDFHETARTIAFDDAGGGFDIADAGNTFTVGSTLSGTGPLFKTGAGVLAIQGSNSYSGGTVVGGGTLSVSSEANLGAAAGGLVLDGGTLQVTGTGFSGTSRAITLGDAGGSLDIASAGNTFTIGSAISGNGPLGKTGRGTLVLTGANTYAGGTSIDEGTLSGTTETLQGDISDNASLVFNQAIEGHFTGAISGVGSLSKLGAGTLVLDGPNSYTGGTTVSTGVLRGDASSLQGDILDEANVTFDQDDPGTFGGNVSGIGSLGKTGAGELRMTGHNTYTGLTTIDSGILRGDTDSLPGDIANHAALVFDQSDAGTYAGVMTGDGSLAKQGTGSLVLNGDSSGFTGSTTVRQGALVVGDDTHAGAVLGSNVAVDDGAVLGGHGTIGGNAVLAGGAHLSPGNSLGTLHVAGDLDLAQGSQLDFEFGAPAAGGSFATSGQSDNVDVGGDLSIEGATLNIAANAGFGPGLYNLFSYAGTLATSNGGIALGAAPGGTYSIQYLGDSRQINLLNTGGLTLQFWNANGEASSGRLGGGNGTWSLTAPNWTDAQGTTNAPMQPVPGFAIFGGTAGTVTVDNADGAVQATGLQFASDGYALDGDALTLAADAGHPAPVSISVGDGTAASAAWTATIGNVLAGSDGLAKTGAGTLVLTGANTYTGGTTIDAGILSVASDANLGGEGGLTLDGGTIRITGGTFHDTARTVTLGNAGGGFDIADAGNTFSVSSALSGSGSLVKAGAGTLVLTGTNSYSGGTTVDGGTLVGNTASLRGDVMDNAAVVFDQAGDGVFDGSLSGNGRLDKQGDGTLTMNGANAFDGSTRVRAGSLIVGDDSHAGAVLRGPLTVAAGATLGGTGTIGNLDLSGTVAPGHSIGTLTVDGDAVFEQGSRYAFEVAPDGSSDHIAVTGKATLLGGEVLALGSGADWSPLSDYTLLTAGDGVTGTFAGVSSSLAFLDPRLSYDANAVHLTLTRNDVSFASVAATRNQRATADAINSLGDGTLYNIIVPLDAAQARNAFDQLSGEIHANTRTVALDDARYVRDAVNRHLVGEDMGNHVDTGRGSVWTSAWGHWGDRGGDGNAARTQANGSGLLVGADVRLGTDAVLGAVVGQSQASARTARRSADASLDATHLGIYGSAAWGAFQLRGGVNDSLQTYDTHRDVAIGAFHDHPDAHYDGRLAQAYVEAGYRFAFERGSLEPYLNLARAHLHTDGYREHGGAAALDGRAESGNTDYATAGMRVHWTLAPQSGARAYAGLGYQQAWGRIRGDSHQAFASGGDSFAIAGLPIARRTGVADVGIDFRLGQRTTVDAGYHGQFGGGFKDQGARLSLEVAF